MKGRVFSIEEFSIYDGPGIRMTIFLKGCPLRCNWCHNPEGVLYEKQIVRTDNGCLKCFRCLDAAEHATGKRVLSEESIPACPRNLIRVSGTDYEPDEIAERVLKNAAILNAAGGGVTFSGGEPLLQADFLREALRLLAGKVNRAIQTSGYAPNAVFLNVLEHVDYVLFDLKLIDEAEHVKYIGKSNQCILQNFEALKRSGIPFVVRVPLIPGVTDTPRNLKQIALLAKGAKALAAVELLPYNKMAGSKYAMVGRKYQPMFDAEQPVNADTAIFLENRLNVRIL